MINARQQFTVHRGDGLAADVLAANMKIYKQFVNNARALQSKVRGADVLQVGEDSEEAESKEDSIISVILNDGGAADVTHLEDNVIKIEEKIDSEEIVDDAICYACIAVI